MAVKNVYTIAPTLCFADTLAAELMAKNAPENLAKMTLFLPTRRACKTMRDAFLRQSFGTPMLLPRMIGFGGLDSEETLTELSVLGAEDIPEALPPLRRRLLLMRLILKKQEMSAEKALQLADALAAFLDESYIEKTGLDRLQSLVPDEFAEHWQETLRFLEIITAAWPDILKSYGVIDAADRQVRLFEAQAKYWQQNPPTDPIIAAGSTGSQPATALLLDAIASMPNGMVILPGLDRELDDDSFEKIEPSHPQYHLKNLLQTFGISRKDVKDFATAPRTERLRLISEAMRPASTTDKWQTIDKFTDSVLDGIERIDCTSSQEEALTIALALREVLESPEKTAALITPDRALARRVIAEMNRWGVVMDDSAGQPLSATPLGSFLTLIGQVGLNNAAPFDLLACLKHPLAAGQKAYGTFRPLVRQLELSCLHGKRPGNGFDGLINADKTDFCIDLKSRLGGFTDLMQDSSSHAFSDFLTAHLTAAESLAESADRSGADRLWTGESGEVALSLIADLQDNIDLIGSVNAVEYMALLNVFMHGALVRPKYGMHPRLDILGTMEARLIRPDVLILGGLNEGVWPKTIEADPWLSRPMRQNCGMPAPERKIALSAHDFCQAFCAPKVILTRSLKSGGTPTVPSRWLMRLDAVLNASEIRWGEGDYKKYSRLLDKPDRIVSFQPPRPCPPVSARPRKLSVTKIETLFRDPYSIYAQYVLGLKKLDEIDRPLNMADFGSALHLAVEQFCRRFPTSVPDNAEDIILDLGQQAIKELNFSITAETFWKPRINETLLSFVARQRENIGQIKRIYPEQKGEITLSLSGGNFTLTGRADRIDELKDGTFALIDYKTGTVPKEKQVLAGYSPQLPLEAEIIHRNGFKDLPAGDVSCLEYWQLKPKGKVIRIKADSQELTEATLERLVATVNAYDNPDTPYLPTPDTSVSMTYNDYNHLARFDEWATQENNEDNDESD